MHVHDGIERPHHAGIRAVKTDGPGPGIASTAIALKYPASAHAIGLLEHQVKLKDGYLKSHGVSVAYTIDRVNLPVSQQSKHSHSIDHKQHEHDDEYPQAVVCWCWRCW